MERGVFGRQQVRKRKDVTRRVFLFLPSCKRSCHMIQHGRKQVFFDRSQHDRDIGIVAFVFDEFSVDNGFCAECFSDRKFCFPRRPNGLCVEIFELRETLCAAQSTISHEISTKTFHSTPLPTHFSSTNITLRTSLRKPRTLRRIAISSKKDWCCQNNFSKKDIPQPKGIKNAVSQTIHTFSVRSKTNSESHRNNL